MGTDDVTQKTSDDQFNQIMARPVSMEQKVNGTVARLGSLVDKVDGAVARLVSLKDKVDGNVARLDSLEKTKWTSGLSTPPDPNSRIPEPTF